MATPVRGMLLGALSASVQASGDDHSGAEESVYTFDYPVVHVSVHKEEDIGESFFVIWNPDIGGAGHASPTNWDEILPAHVANEVYQHTAQAPFELRVISVSIYSTGASTYGTDFNVRGWYP